MTKQDTTGELDARFSDPAATATAWPEARDRIAQAELYWLTTVRRDGRPHQTPLIGVFVDDTFYFCTGPTEQKARNMEHSAHCLVTTGCNALHEGLDVVIEGDAVALRDDTALRRIRRRLRVQIRKRMALRGTRWCVPP